MIEQINLYHARFRKKELLLPLSRMITIIFLSTLIFPALIGFNHLKMSELKKQSIRLHADYNKLENEWKVVRETLTKIEPDESLLSGSSKLNTILAHRTELLAFIENNSFENATGYSDYLIALARQHTQNIWLTSIAIAKNGTSLSIEGKINNSAALPLYLQRLENEPILAHTQFVTLKITRDSTDLSEKSPLSFIIASAPPALEQ